MTSTSFLRPAVLPCLLVTLAAVACGGTYVPNDGEGDDGSESGGHPGTGGLVHSGGQPSAGGQFATGGAPATGGQTGAGGCCAAAAVCDEGDTEMESGGDCPIGAVCYSNSICCGYVWCMDAQDLCDGIPRCQEGEIEVSACPEDATCVKRALCGTVITCEVPGPVLCDTGSSIHVKWVGNSIAECEVIDYSCPPYTTGFSNQCGCGCQQPNTCPEFIDCEPGGTLDPLCDSEECPYSQRAY